MIMKTENKEVSIVIRSRKIASLTQKLGGKNLNDCFFKANNNCELEALAMFIKEFAEIDGKQAFNSNNEVLDFIDDYKLENNKSYSDIYKELAEEINNMGFFTKKFEGKALEKQLAETYINIDLENMVNKVAEKEVGEVVQNEFKGYKG